MIRWIRQVVPLWPISIFLLFFVVFEGWVVYMEWRIGRRVAMPARPGLTLIYVSSFFYGLHRAIVFHPFYRTEYGEWLSRTPWRVEKPGPLGPIDLTWQDGAILGALILLLLTQPQEGSVKVLNLFLISYCVPLTASLFATGVSGLGYLAAFGLGFSLRAWPWPWACLATTVPVYLVVREGVWRSLARFPWNLKWRLTDLNNVKNLGEKLLGPSCGWPFDRYVRDLRLGSIFRFRLADAVLIGLLTGWWLSSIQSLAPTRDAKWAIAVIIGQVLFFAALGNRGALYFKHYRSPLSLAGRLGTGRLFIPRFDVALLPLPTILLLGLGLPGYLLARQLDPELIAILVISPIVTLALAMPPGLWRWFLIGGHQIEGGRHIQGPNAEYIKVG